MASRPRHPRSRRDQLRATLRVRDGDRHDPVKWAIPARCRRGTVRRARRPDRSPQLTRHEDRVATATATRRAPSRAAGRFGVVGSGAEPSVRTAAVIEDGAVATARRPAHVVLGPAWPPRNVAVPSVSKRRTAVRSAPVSAPTSAATAARTCSGWASRAARVATRRSAACSSAIRPSVARASALVIAVATNSINADMRCSVSEGNRSRRLPTTRPPQTCPPTTIGIATDQRMPRLRTNSASSPGTRS